MIEDFVGAVLGAVRASSLEELAAASSKEPPPPAVKRRDHAIPPPRKRRRLRSSKEELRAYTEKIVALVAKSPRGLRAGALRDAVKIEGRELARAVHYALVAGTIVRQGTRGETLYLPARPREVPAPGRPARVRPRVRRADRAPVENNASDSHASPEPEAGEIREPEALLHSQELPTLPVERLPVEPKPSTAAEPSPKALVTPSLREGEELLRTPTGHAVLRRKAPLFA